MKRFRTFGIVANSVFVPIDAMLYHATGKPYFLFMLCVNLVSALYLAMRFTSSGEPHSSPATSQK